MADLTDGRGQVLLIAAFTLAVTFVALALVVNSAIFTENLASRGEISGSSQALYYQQEVRAGVAGTIAFANVHNHSALPVATGLDDTVEEGVEDLATQGGTQQSLGGHLVDVEFVTTTDGTRLVSNESGGSTFLSAGGATDWLLAEDVDETRDVTVHISDTDFLHDGASDSSFRLELNQSSPPTEDFWNVTIRRQSGSVPYDVIVEVQTPNGDTGECRVTATADNRFDFEVDVTGAVVDGQHCPALARMGTSGTQMQWATGIPDANRYNISIEHGDEIEGNYSMVIRPRGAQEISNFNLFPVDPYTTDAVYGARVRYVYHTADIAYESILEVVPGDPDD